MSEQRYLTRADILNAKAVYLYDDDTVFVELGNDEVYGFNSKHLYWDRKDNFYDYFESSLMLSFISPITADEAIARVEKALGKALA